MSYVPSGGTSYEDVTVTVASHFSIVSVDAPTSVAPNATFTITVTVKNDGTESGDVIVRLYENDNLVGTQTLTLNAGEQANASFTRQAPSSTTTLSYKVEAYNVSTDTIDDQETFTVSVTSGGGGGGTTTGGVSATAIIGLIILVFLLLLIFARRKQT